MNAKEILLKDKSIMRPDGQTAKIFSYMCYAKNTKNVVISSDFTEYKWVSIADLKTLPHVGIEEDVRKAYQLLKANINLALFEAQSVREDLRT